MHTESVVTAPDAKAVEAAIQQVKVTSDIVRADPAVDAWLKHLKVVVDAAQAYLDAQKAEPVAWRVESGPWNALCATEDEAKQLQADVGDDDYNGPCTIRPLYDHPSPKDPT
jgi:hypothetical protein